MTGPTHNQTQSKAKMSNPEKLMYMLELNRFMDNNKSSSHEILEESKHLILVDHNQLAELGNPNISFSKNMGRLLFEIQNLNFYKREKQQISMVYKPRNLKNCGNPHCPKQLTHFADDWQVFYFTSTYKSIEARIGIASCEDPLCLETCRNMMDQLNQIMIQKANI